LMSVAAIVLATELRFLQRILDTVELSGTQWLVCIGAGGLTIVAVSELRKLLLRRREPKPEPEPEAAAA
jgi:P-type Ca2+ transporter type 2C